jgi:hypothetical protein
MQSIFGLFGKKENNKEIAVEESPSNWHEFLGKDKKQNKVFVNQKEDAISVTGTMIAGEGQKMVFDNKGLNGQGAKNNKIESVVAGKGSTVTFSLLI